ncbi:MAG: AtpZ/AtpI family protein [Parcubacteria group bacterium]|jgi:F0F1-type ATP synthase assembly protein I
MADEKKDDQESWSAASLAWELGYLIAIPLVVLALLGRFIDRKYHTEPWFFLLGIILAILITSYTVYKKSKDIIDK